MLLGVGHQHALLGAVEDRRGLAQAGVTGVLFGQPTAAEQVQQQGGQQDEAGILEQQQGPKALVVLGQGQQQAIQTYP